MWLHPTFESPIFDCDFHGTIGGAVEETVARVGVPDTNRIFRIDELIGTEGHALLHNTAVQGKPPADNQSTLVYVRPHSLEIRRQPNGETHFRATIKHINAAGPLVKVEAVTEWGGPVHVEMSQERFRDLQLTNNESVFITPRDVKVFDGHSSD